MNRCRELKNRRLIGKFLRQHVTKDTRGQRILELLMACECLLSKVQLVESIRHLPNAILVSAEGAQTFPFICRINDIYYDDVEVITKLLQGSFNQPLYLWLSVDKDLTCSLCGESLLVTSDLQAQILLKKFTRSLDDKLATSYFRKERSKLELMRKIDEALAEGNREMFSYYAEKYKNLVCVK